MIRYLNELEQVLNKFNISKSDICLINSCAISDIRDNRDLDFAILPATRKRIVFMNFNMLKISKNGTIYFSENVQSVNNRYSQLGISDEMLFDDENHDVINGYFVVKREIEIAKKVLLQRDKDIEDLNYIAINSSYKSLDWKKVYTIAYFSNPLFSTRYIRKRLSIIKRKLVHLIRRNKNKQEVIIKRKKSEFIAIVWGTMFCNFEEIRKFIENKYKILEHKIIEKDDNLADFVEQLYDIDDIDKWKIRIKQAYLSEKNSSIEFIKFEIENGTYKLNKRTGKNMCIEEVKLKKEIRQKYSKRMNDYIYDVIIHICDNSDNNERIESII